MISASGAGGIAIGCMYFRVGILAAFVLLGLGPACGRSARVGCWFGLFVGSVVLPLVAWWWLVVVWWLVGVLVVVFVCVDSDGFVLGSRCHDP